MRVHFVGHASVVLDYGDVVVLTDPWLRGDAFNDGWAAWPPPQLADELLARVTHLWVSHEHPDHLSIPTLRAIPPERRAGIHLLYQLAWSPEVVTFLRSLGWASVTELAHGRAHPLSPRVRATVLQFGHEDSALVLHADGATVLNLNDCKPGPRGLARLRRLAGPVDLLLDQFSIAGWPGNPDQPERHAERSQRALATFATHVRELDPTWVLPFASMMRFAHVENAYVNEAAVPVHAAAERVGSRAVVLYPGNSWVLGEAPPTEPALQGYSQAYAMIPDQPLRTHPPVPVAEVVEAMRRRVGELAQAYHRPVRALVGPVSFELVDGGTAVTVDVAAGTVRAHEPGGANAVEVSTQAARAAFTDRWGLPTLLISARLRTRGDERGFLRLKQLGATYSTGLRTRGMLRHLVGTERGRALVGTRSGQLFEDYLSR